MRNTLILSQSSLMFEHLQTRQVREKSENRQESEAIRFILNLHNISHTNSLIL